MAKKAKRGRKPGVKYGPYKKRKTALVKVAKVTSSQPNILSICRQLEEMITELEKRITSINQRINGLL